MNDSPTSKNKSISERLRTEAPCCYLSDCGTCATCVGAAEIERLDKDLTEALTERDWAQDRLQATHIALGGDGEWSGKLPPQAPPDSGDLHYDVPALAAERMAEIEHLRTAMRYWVALPIWQPIDTAPPGSLPILITDGAYITEAWRRGDRWEATCDGYVFADACYWMPIPMIPKRPDSETKDSP